MPVHGPRQVVSCVCLLYFVKVNSLISILPISVNRIFADQNPVDTSDRQRLRVRHSTKWRVFSNTVGVNLKERCVLTVKSHRHCRDRRLDLNRCV